MPDYTINDGSANVSYDIISQQSPQSNVFELVARETTRALATPQTLRISHTNSKTNSGSDRHLVQFSITDEDDDKNLYTGTVHVVITAPRAEISSSELEAEWTKLKTFVSSNWASIYRGSMP